MAKSKFYGLLAVTCLLSAIAGISLGYFVFGPLGVSARDSAREDAGEDADDGFYPDGLPAYVSLDAPAPMYEAEEYPDAVAFEHQFIVTSVDGVIVVYYAGEVPTIKEVTPIYTNSFPEEEQIRLEKGIRVYTEEALMRLLEDYGS